MATRLSHYFTDDTNIMTTRLSSYYSLSDASNRDTSSKNGIIENINLVYGNLVNDDSLPPSSS